MSISNQQKGQQAINRLKVWIDSNPEVPIYKGRINKTVICDSLNISKSTISSNQELKVLFDNLESSITDYKMQNIKGENERQLQNIINNLEIKLALAEKEVDELKAKIKLNEHLLETGRVINA